MKTSSLRYINQPGLDHKGYHVAIRMLSGSVCLEICYLSIVPIASSCLLLYTQSLGEHLGIQRHSINMLGSVTVLSLDLICSYYLLCVDAHPASLHPINIQLTPITSTWPAPSTGFVLFLNLHIVIVCTPPPALKLLDTLLTIYLTHSAIIYWVLTY